MPAAARVGDNIKQDAPHCHNPGHPVGTATAPIPHPPMPLAITDTICPTVVIQGQQAATVGSKSQPCSLAGCIPAGPGVVAKGSMTVCHGGAPAARVNDITGHPSCVAPIPSPVGKVLPPGATTVIIGG